MEPLSKKDGQRGRMRSVRGTGDGEEGEGDGGGELRIGTKMDKEMKG